MFCVLPWANEKSYSQRANRAALCVCESGWSGQTVQQIQQQYQQLVQAYDQHLPQGQFTGPAVASLRTNSGNQDVTPSPDSRHPAAAQ